MPTAQATQGSIIVAPFTVAVDHRERAAAYQFNDMPLPAEERRLGRTLVVKSEFQHLITGDYSIVGFEEEIAVERKSLEDLFGTLSGGRSRFRAEMGRLSEMDFAAIVVEATWGEICNPSRSRGDWRSEMSPFSVWGTIWSWSQRYPKVHWFTMGTRRLAELGTWEILKRWEEHHGGE